MLQRYPDVVFKILRNQKTANIIKNLASALYFFENVILVQNNLALVYLHEILIICKRKMAINNFR